VNRGARSEFEVFSLHRSISQCTCIVAWWEIKLWNLNSLLDGR